MNNITVLFNQLFLQVKVKDIDKLIASHIILSDFLFLYELLFIDTLIDLLHILFNTIMYISMLKVKTSGNAILSGAKTFSSPLYSRKAVVPEMFQGYNLSWLDQQLSVSPPRGQYQAQLAALGDIQSQAELSLAGE